MQITSECQNLRTFWNQHHIMQQKCCSHAHRFINNLCTLIEIYQPRLHLHSHTHAPTSNVEKPSVVSALPVASTDPALGKGFPKRSTSFPPPVVVELAPTQPPIHRSRLFYVSVTCSDMGETLMMLSDEMQSHKTSTKTRWRGR